MIEVAKVAHEEGVAGFCVALLDEAIQFKTRRIPRTDSDIRN